MIETGPLPIVASALVGASVGLITFIILEAADIRLRWTRLRPPSLQRVGILLAKIAVPRLLAQKWQKGVAEHHLIQSGLAWPVAGLVGLRWVAAWLAMLSSASILLVRSSDLLSLFLAGCILAIGFVGPGTWLAVRAEKRRVEIDLALPDFLDRLALGLGAGLSFDLAFRRTATSFLGLLGGEMRRVTRQIDRGRPRDIALDLLSLRNPSSDLQAFVATVKQAEKLGSSLAESLLVQTRLLRARRRRRAEEASRRLPVLVVFPLVIFFLPALLIIYLAPPLLHLFLGL